MCEFVIISKPNSIAYDPHNTMYIIYLACTSTASWLFHTHIIPRAGPLGYKVRVRLHSFCHLLRDLIDERVKGLLYVDIIFGAGLDVLYPERVGQLFGIFLGNGSDVRQVRFIANQDYSGILPWEISDGGSPVCVHLCVCVSECMCVIDGECASGID